MSNRRFKVTILVLGGLIVGPAYLLGDYTLNWYTVDGGGETACTAGGYELSGTAGQPDASMTVLTGGGYELTGGFWTRFGHSHPPIPVDPNAVDLEPTEDLVKPWGP